MYTFPRMLKGSLSLYYFLDNAAATTPSLAEKKIAVCDIHAEKKCCFSKAKKKKKKKFGKKFGKKKSNKVEWIRS